MSLFRPFAKQAALYGLFLCAAVTLLTALGSPGASAKDAILTKDSVERFLASFPEIEALGLVEGVKTASEAKSAKNPLFAAITAVRSSKAQPQVLAIVTNHGFQSVSEWSDTGKAIALAYVHITQGKNGELSHDKMEKHKEDLAKSIDKMKFLTAEQKAKMKEKLEKTADNLAKDPPAENIAIVTEKRGEIEAVVNGLRK